LSGEAKRKKGDFFVKERKGKKGKVKEKGKKN